MPQSRWKGHLPWNWSMGSGGVEERRRVVIMDWQVWSHSEGQVQRRRRRWRAVPKDVSAAENLDRKCYCSGNVAGWLTDWCWWHIRAAVLLLA
jgi:hypothetical protein